MHYQASVFIYRKWRFKFFYFLETYFGAIRPYFVNASAKSEPISRSRLPDKVGDRMTQVNSDPIRVYLEEVGRTPLLTAEKELVLAKHCRAGSDLIQRRQAEEKQIGRCLTHAEAANHAEMPLIDYLKAVRKFEYAKKQMVQANLRLVVSIAKKYLNRGVDFLDLIQEGSIGLMRAVEKFEPERGYKFSTYAYWWIRQAITRCVATSSRPIRLPANVVEKLNTIKTAQRRVVSRGEGLTPVAIVDELNAMGKRLWTVPLLESVMSQSILTLSLNRCIGTKKGMELELGDLLEDRNNRPIDYVHAEEMNAISTQFLEDLTQQQQAVVRLRYGLDDGVSHTLDAIALRLDLSRERIRQIQQQSLRKMRNRAERLERQGKDYSEVLQG